MERAKRAFKEISTELKITAMHIYQGDASVLTKRDKVALVFIGIFIAIWFATNAAFAAGDIFDAIEGEFITYYGKLAGLATIVAALCILVGFLWVMVSPGQRSSAVPIGWIKTVFLCYFAIMILGGIFGVIKNITAGQEFTP